MKNLLWIISIFLLLCACSTKREIIEIPVETVKTEYIHNLKIDSIYIKDSVDRYTNGDTVFIYKEHTQYKYLIQRDTIIKVDSVPKIIKERVVEEVEVNHIKWYQKIFMWIGGITSLLLTGFIIYKLKFRI